MYVADSGDNKIREYDLSTPWDVSTASLNKAVDSYEASSIDGIFIRSDGNKMYEITSDNLNEFDLSTKWDISTKQYKQQVNLFETDNPQGITFGQK